VSIAVEESAAERVLAVRFEAPGGRTCDAIGGGPTVAGAIAWARDSCSCDSSWDVVLWSDLYGD